MPSFPDPKKTVYLTLSLSPAATLHLHSGSQEDAIPGDVAWRLEKAFAQNQGLFQLGIREAQTVLPPALAFWRNFSTHFMRRVSTLPELPKKNQPLEIPLPEEDIAHWLGAAPPMQGLDFLNAESLRQLWNELERTLAAHLVRYPASAARFFQRLHPSWHKVGKVTLHLTENPLDPLKPFALSATYSAVTQGATGLTHSQDLPLHRALQVYAGPQHRGQLDSLLGPLREAAKTSVLLNSLLESGRLYEGVTWTPTEAYWFLLDAESFETLGIGLRIPDWWKKRARPHVKVVIGEQATSELTAQSLLDFSAELTLGDHTLTREEWEAIQASQSNLVLIKGQWVEVDRARLQEVLNHWKKVERGVAKGGLSFFDGMRLLAGAPVAGIEPIEENAARPWGSLVAGKELSLLLKKLTNPKEADRIHPGESLKATLRPYQDVGLRWLWLMTQIGIGACLADDMGLGKTVQVLALLVAMKQKGLSLRHLLVVPASLLGNWQSEIKRFTPSLRVHVVHPSAGAESKPHQKIDLSDVDLVVTTYGGLLRWNWLLEENWYLAILDEAQAIKNPMAQQTRAVKRIKSSRRLVLTGTPVENRLSDLWSLFDFLSPGLLGGHSEFLQGLEKMAARNESNFQPLRALVRPYILRRLKTDKTVIADLPEKTEMNAYCTLTPPQAALYQKSVDQLSEQMDHLTGLKRKGTILAFLMRLKQICNHPSHWLGDSRFLPEDSGKFLRLKELAEVIAGKQEKMLLFTQFRKMTRPLAEFLESIFERPGLVLDGHTPVIERARLVNDFQKPDGPPFFVLSLKAGGTGLNLTAATHVIHFDRWWNPAVENQATDRAYRIGQTRNVLVHKLICRGTVEEKIDKLITSKVNLAQDVIDPKADRLLTEMSDRELLALLRLDLYTALAETMGTGAGNP